MPAEFIKARPTTYNGIAMRSRLEATFAQLLDNLGLSWEYEPMCFASSSGQYLPDFRLHVHVCLDNTDHHGLCQEPSVDGVVPLFVEVKPKPIIYDDVKLNDVANRMEIIWESIPHAELCLYVPETDDAWVAHGCEMDGQWYHQNPSRFGQADDLSWVPYIGPERNGVES